MIARGPTWAGLAWAGAPLLACLGLLAWSRLGQVRALAVATARLIAQMLLLATVLRLVIAADRPPLVLAIGLAMLALAAHAVGSRRPRDRLRLRAEAFVAMLISSGLVMAVAVRLALRVEPWYEPQTVIPMLGMILGNAVSAVALAAERFDAGLDGDADLVELRLTLGATRRQAAAPALRAAVGAGLAPILSNMTIAGIVAIPGMTSGQLLAGADVGTAIRYQILLYLAIAATVALSILILLAARLRRRFTSDHQLRRSGPSPS